MFSLKVPVASWMKNVERNVQCFWFARILAVGMSWVEMESILGKTIAWTFPNLEGLLRAWVPLSGGLAHPYQIPFSSASRILILTLRLPQFLTPCLGTLAIVHVKGTFDNEVCVNLGIFLNCRAVLAKSNIRILIAPSKSLLAENLLHLEKHSMFETVA